ncbi:MAG: hypothetical protein R2688_01805 [Fimbriimonadaceae bacterium]
MAMTVLQQSYSYETSSIQTIIFGDGTAFIDRVTDQSNSREQLYLSRYDASEQKSVVLKKLPDRTVRFDKGGWLTYELSEGGERYVSHIGNLEKRVRVGEGFNVQANNGGFALFSSNRSEYYRLGSDDPITLNLGWSDWMMGSAGCAFASIGAPDEQSPYDVVVYLFDSGGKFNIRNKGNQGIHISDIDESGEIYGGIFEWLPRYGEGFRFPHNGKWMVGSDVYWHKMKPAIWSHSKAVKILPLPTDIAKLYGTRIITKLGNDEYLLESRTDKKEWHELPSLPPDFEIIDERGALEFYLYKSGKVTNIEKLIEKEFPDSVVLIDFDRSNRQLLFQSGKYPNYTMTFVQL